MAEFSLQALDPLASESLPFSAGEATLSAPPPEQLLSVQPFSGQEKAVTGALKKTLDTSLEPHKAGSALWMGQGIWFLVNVDTKRAARAIDQRAAITDQSDAWATFDLTGADAAAVMARLCPLDLDAEIFPPSATARSEFAHMMASITAIEGGFRVRVMRSFAKTALHHTRDAIRSVAAQRSLPK